jgi:hypothetical protein
VDDSLRRAAQAARADLGAGWLRGAALLERLLAVPFLERDVWLDEALGIEPPPPDVPDLPRGAVPYLPCGVDEIIAMVRQVPLRSDDELVDLGSGLGRVVVLAHLLSGARACGIEIQEPLVHRATELTAALRLDAVSFRQADAASSALDGTVFFLYAPCNGAMLARLLARLQEVARRHAIVVCSVGLELGGVDWLAPRSSSSVSLAIYDSRLAAGSLVADQGGISSVTPAGPAAPTT